MSKKNNTPEVGLEPEAIGLETEAAEALQNQDEQPCDCEDNIVDKLTADLATTQEALEKEKKEYLFLMAEFDNFRKRTIKEKSDIIRNASAKAMEGLLPVVDDFERGLAATNDEGMHLIYNKLVKYLESNGVKAIESTGQQFNPDLHEAIAMVPTGNPEQKGIVIDTPTKGYTINDKVLRHAKVVVGE